MHIVSPHAQLVIYRVAIQTLMSLYVCTCTLLNRFTCINVANGPMVSHVAGPLTLHCDHDP